LRAHGDGASTHSTGAPPDGGAAAQSLIKVTDYDAAAGNSGSCYGPVSAACNADPDCVALVACINQDGPLVCDQYGPITYAP
jgi:hypothetical protein